MLVPEGASSNTSATRDGVSGADLSVLRNVASSNPAAIWSSLGDTFSWVEVLPEGERQLFVDEVTRALLAPPSPDDDEPLSVLIREWRSTAELHADRALVRRLGRPLTTSDRVGPTTGGSATPDGCES